MWLIKDKEMINIDDIEHIEYRYYEEDNEYELVFNRYGKEIAYFFFKTEKEVKDSFEKIINGIRLGSKIIHL
jgi:hypothetical protein